jgi:hypothetical protein
MNTKNYSLTPANLSGFVNALKERVLASVAGSSPVYQEMIGREFDRFAADPESLYKLKTVEDQVVEKDEVPAGAERIPVAKTTPAPKVPETVPPAPIQ